MSQEFIAKAKEASSAEEILALAKENNVEMTAETAKELFERLNASGELSDDELDGVAGGLTILGEEIICPTCKSWIGPFVMCRNDNPDGIYISFNCRNCGQPFYRVYPVGSIPEN